MHSHHLSSLSSRLWLVIALAVLPLFVMFVFDYLGQRDLTVSQAERDMARMLEAAKQEEAMALRAVRSTLGIMANSDNLASLDAEECSGIASRLLSILSDFNNLGAALPDGTLFCSGLPLQGRVRLDDRQWFKDASTGSDISAGEYAVGRISGRPSMVFGYPLRDGTELRAVLFASLSLAWFDRLVAAYRLPEGWEAILLSNAGEVLARYPDGHPWKGVRLPEEKHAAFLGIKTAAGGVGEVEGLEGALRLYGVRGVSFAGDMVDVVIGAPLGRSLADVDRAFSTRVALLALVALISALAARYAIRALIERWAGSTREVLARIAEGAPATSIAQPSDVFELRAVEEGIERMAVELARREAELRRLSMAVEQSPESVVITDPHGRIEYVNDAFCRVTGYAREELIGQNPRILNKGRTSEDTYRELWATILRGEVWRGEFDNVRKDGSSYTEFATIAPIKSADGVITHFVAVKEDITLRRQSEALVHRLAYYDALTELPNRALMRDRLQHAVLSSAHTGDYAMLLLLDIDRFKQLNDTQGHAAGDRLLQAVARRLRQVLREEDTAARQGDDDFAVIVEHLGRGKEEALIRAEGIAKEIQAVLGAPYDDLDDSGRPHYMSFSIGITLFQGRQWAIENLLKQVEVALYMAKEEGRNTTRFFSPQMQARVQAHAEMEAALRQALDEGVFQLFYQPQFCRDGKLVGAEVLARWPVEGGRMVSPADFIPVAEDTGLIVPLGGWVLDTACRQLAAWQAQPGTRTLSLAVNVSARQFHQPDFVLQVTSAMQRHGIMPSALKLELTESVILGDIDETVARMAQLRTLGVRFSLDDFGTGYSSLSYLRRLPLDQIKIDQSFVRDMLDNAGSETIVLAILGMSRSLGLEVIAEGVETEAQHAFLLEHGCQRFQGYLLGKPLPLAAWPAHWLDSCAGD